MQKAIAKGNFGFHPKYGKIIKGHLYDVDDNLTLDKNELFKKPTSKELTALNKQED